MKRDGIENGGSWIPLERTRVPTLGGSGGWATLFSFKLMDYMENSIKMV